MTPGKTIVVLPSLAVLAVLSCSAPPGPSRLGPGDEEGRGADLFGRHCALCHGADGSGSGDAAPYLFPRPRDFGAAKFRLVSTENGVPTDDDLLGVLRRGMPGSAMPGFAWMDEDDLRALTGHVRQLTENGIARRLQQQGMASHDATAAARRQMTPGAVVTIGAEAPDTPATLEHGRSIYAAHCAPCHRTDGRGERPDTPYDASGTFQWPRDFTQGILKGGASHRDLALRVRAGLPGSTMEPSSLNAEQTAAVVAFVRSMIAPDAEQRLVQVRRALVARRVDEAPRTPSDPAWRDANEQRLALAPLVWSDAAILQARVAALHDGTSIAVRLRWPDPTNDGRAERATWTDAAALQFSSAEHPPLFGMGSTAHSVDIWHWKPFVEGEASAVMDMQRALHQGLVPGRPTSDVPVYSRSWPAGREVEAHGMKSAEGFASAARTLFTAPSREDGWWSVVFRRDLAPTGKEQLRLEPGARVQVACAIWNGAARDHDAQKSISIWHELTIGR